MDSIQSFKLTINNRDFLINSCILYIDVREEKKVYIAGRKIINSD